VDASEREFDVVVFGATSVTGRRIAGYLAELGEAAGSWAAAARSPEKLERVLAEEGVAAPATITADVGDPASLEAMASRARTVVNLVGPYTRYGEPVIAACIAGGAHYVDADGAIPFSRRMAERYDDAAREAGVKVVKTCGFESLPPDLLVALAVETARERWDERVAEVDLEVAVTGMPSGMPRPSDMLSGGTMQSVAEMAGDPDAARLMDPALLIEDPVAADAVRRVSPIKIAPRRGASGSVIAPMAPAPFINPAVIQRTAALLADEAGEPFEPFAFREGVAIGGSPATLPLRYAAAGTLSGIQAGLGAMTRASERTRARVSSAMARALPDSGFGPRPDRLEDWGWRMTVHGRTADGREVETRVDAEGHPGYLATSRLMGEAGLLLAEPGATPDRAGFLTPATAIGTGRLERFERARLRFSVA
jgi:short subunit dehydrogenase-like uncharacterized protein